MLYSSTDIKQLLEPVVDNKDVVSLYKTMLKITKNLVQYLSTASIELTYGKRTQYSAVNAKVSCALSELYRERKMSAKDFVDLDIYYKFVAVQIESSRLAIDSSDSTAIKQLNNFEKYLGLNIKKLLNTKDKSMSEHTKVFIRMILDPDSVVNKNNNK